MEFLKYKSKFALALDLIAYVITYLWGTSFSLCSACYFSTTQEKSQPLLKAIHYAVFGPVLGILMLALLPAFLVGQLLWIFVCNCFEHTDFAIVNFPSTIKRKFKSSVFTFASGNLILGVEPVGKFQNMNLVYKRAFKIAKAIVDLMGNAPIKNCQILDDPNSKAEVCLKSAVSSSLPDVDFFCFQEVWDRFFAAILIRQLKKKFSHFLIDVSKHELRRQMCMGSSGLMIASKYPIMEANFYKFRFQGGQLFMRLIDYGCVMAKLDLGIDKDGIQHVGYLANLHMMAYQGKENLVGGAMTEVQTEFKAFRQRTKKKDEKTNFAVISGDFNIDNISPADAISRDHPLFNEYNDYPMLEPGRDKSWSVGTELRQLRIYDRELSNPFEMEKMLTDNVARRHFVIDADVQEQTMDLMYCDPKPDEDGQVREDPEAGGRRRIDRIIYDPKTGSKPVGFQFLTSLAGLTDHVPVAMSLQTNLP